MKVQVKKSFRDAHRIIAPINLKEKHISQFLFSFAVPGLNVHWTFVFSVVVLTITKLKQQFCLQEQLLKRVQFFLSRFSLPKACGSYIG